MVDVARILGRIFGAPEKSSLVESLKRELDIHRAPHAEFKLPRPIPQQKIREEVHVPREQLPKFGQVTPKIEVQTEPTPQPKVEPTPESIAQPPIRLPIEGMPPKPSLEATLPEMRVTEQVIVPVIPTEEEMPSKVIEEARGRLVEKIFAPDAKSQIDEGLTRIQTQEQKFEQLMQTVAERSAQAWEAAQKFVHGATDIGDKETAEFSSIMKNFQLQRERLVAAEPQFHKHLPTFLMIALLGGTPMAMRWWERKQGMWKAQLDQLDRMATAAERAYAAQASQKIANNLRALQVQLQIARELQRPAELAVRAGIAMGQQDIAARKLQLDTLFRQQKATMDAERLELQRLRMVAQAERDAARRKQMEQSLRLRELAIRSREELAKASLRLREALAVAGAEQRLDQQTVDEQMRLLNLADRALDTIKGALTPVIMGETPEQAAQRTITYNQAAQQYAVIINQLRRLGIDIPITLPRSLEIR